MVHFSRRAAALAVLLMVQIASPTAVGAASSAGKAQRAHQVRKLGDDGLYFNRDEHRKETKSVPVGKREEEPLVMAPAAEIVSETKQNNEKEEQAKGPVEDQGKDKTPSDTEADAKDCPVSTVIDDGDCGHRFEGTWGTFPLAGYRGDESYAPPASEASAKHRSVWSFKGLLNGIYEVYATWSVGHNGAEDASAMASDARFVVKDGEQEKLKVKVDQRKNPEGNEYEGRSWYRLGSFDYDSDKSLKVILSNNADGTVMADAVRVAAVRQTTDPLERALIVLDTNHDAALSIEEVVNGYKTIRGLFFQKDPDSPYDFNDDGAVNILDLIIMRNAVEKYATADVKAQMNAFAKVDAVSGSNDYAFSQADYLQVKAELEKRMGKEDKEYDFDRSGTVDKKDGDALQLVATIFLWIPKDFAALDENHDDILSIEELVKGEQAFRSAFGKKIASPFDVDEDGDIDNLDLFFFKKTILTKTDPTTLSFYYAYNAMAKAGNHADFTMTRADYLTVKAELGKRMGKDDKEYDFDRSGTVDEKDLQILEEVAARFLTPAAASTLTIVQKTIALAMTAVRNEKDVVLLRFEARANDTEDILLTKLLFDSAAGGAGGSTLKNGRNFYLRVDTDGDGNVDTIIDKNKSAVGSDAEGWTVAFDTIVGGGYVIPKGKTVAFQVFGDIAGSLQDPPVLELRFAASSVSPVAQAESLDGERHLSGISLNGVCPVATCQIDLWTAQGTLVSLKDQGTLTVTKVLGPVPPHQILAGAQSDVLLGLVLSAEDEDIEVMDLQIGIGGASVQSVDRLQLYYEGDTDPFAEASRAACLTDAVPAGATTFCARTRSYQLIVHENQEEHVLIRARMKSDKEGAVSGERIRLFIAEDPVIDTAIGRGAVRASGLFSSRPLLGNDGDGEAKGEVFIGTLLPGPNARIEGPAHIVVFSKIASIVNANRDPDGTQVRYGTGEIGSFTFTTASNINSKNGLNRAVVRELLFDVAAGNVLLSDTFAAYNDSSPTVRTACARATGTAATGNFIVLCRFDGGNVDTEIAPGMSATFTLEATVEDPSIDDSASSLLQVSLTNFADGTKTVVSPSESHIRWDDADVVTATPFTWIESLETVVRSTAYRN